MANLTGLVVFELIEPYRKIKNVYKVAPIENRSVNIDDVVINIETGYEWKDTAAYHQGEEVIVVTIKQRYN